MRKRIDAWLYDNWLEMLIGLTVGEVLAAITIYL